MASNDRTRTRKTYSFFRSRPGSPSNENSVKDRTRAKKTYSYFRQQPIAPIAAVEIEPEVGPLWDEVNWDEFNWG